MSLTIQTPNNVSSGGGGGGGISEVAQVANTALELQAKAYEKELNTAQTKRVKKQVENLKEQVTNPEFKNFVLGPKPVDFDQPAQTQTKAYEDLGYIIKAFEAYIRKKKQEDEAAILLLLSQHGI